MKVTDLRLLNWVRCGHVIGFITEFKSGEQAIIKTGNFEIREEIENLGAIELNEEWLKRMGLDSTIQFMDGVYPNSVLRLEFNEQDCCYYVVVGSDEYRIAKLQFVHEAQNFLALTGHELEIK